MGEFGFSEMVLIVIVAVIIYGKDLPQAARKLAQMYNKLRRQVADIKDEIQRQIPLDEIKNDFTSSLPSDPLAPQVEIPLSPTSVMAQVSGRDAVLVTWNSVPGAATYSLKRSASSVDPLYIVAMNLTDLCYTDTGLEPGKTYHYVVTAQNSAGESGSSEEAVLTLPAEVPAAAPAPTEAAASSANPPPAEPAPPSAEPKPGGDNGNAREPVVQTGEPPAA